MTAYNVRYLCKRKHTHKYFTRFIGKINLLLPDLHIVDGTAAHLASTASRIVRTNAMLTVKRSH